MRKIHILLAGALLFTTGHLSASAQNPPALPEAADFTAKIKNYKGPSFLASIKLGPGANDVVHLLLNVVEKKKGDPGVTLYWAPAAPAGIGPVTEIKASKRRLKAPHGGEIERQVFALPLLSFREAAQTLTHKIELYCGIRDLIPSLAYEDAVTVQRGNARAELVTRGPVALQADKSRWVNLWDRVILEPRRQDMSNPPEFVPMVRMGSGVVMTGQGSVKPIGLTFRTTANPTEIVERGAVDQRAMTMAHLLSQASYPSVQMTTAQPVTEYTVEFACDLGPALGAVSNRVTVTTAEIINRPRSKH